MASLSREEENYVRMGLLLTGISPRAIRTLFDKEFHPLTLDASLKKETMTLTDLKKKKSINQRQWDLIFPRKPGGKDMQKDCEDLKTKVLDRTYKEIILEIKHSQDKIENLLQTTIEELLTRIDEVPPKNIQDQIHNEIEKWKKKDKMFVSTRASDYVIQCLQTNSCVTLTAPSGVGKSFTARHTSLVLQQEDYNIIPVYAPTDIRDYYQPGKKTVFIIDDICGNYIANHQQIENWKQLLPFINTIVEDKQCKIIVCCRLQIYKDDKFNLLSPFLTCECNLIADDLSLTVKEKAEMVDIYIGTKGKNLNIDERQYDFFPLLCDLFHKEKDADVNEFFRNPFGVYKKQIDELYIHGSDGKHKVCSLALCVLFNNRLTEKWFQGRVTDEQRQILEDTCEACRLNRGTSKGELKEALDTLDGTFIREKNGIYSTIHDKLFDFIAHYFGQKMIECLIDHGDDDLVNERFIWQKSPDDKKENLEFIIKIPNAHLDSYLKRLVKIWSAGRVVMVMNNDNMKVSAFRQRLLLYLYQLEKYEQLALSNIKDELEPGIMPLLFTCFQGYTDMVQWLLDNEADVNHCDSVRNIAPVEAWSHIFSYVLRSVHRWTNHVDLCYIDCLTPLYVAIVRGHTDIVQMLILKNANVDICFNCGFRNFLREQQNENNDNMRMLLQESPDNCILNGRCPLSVATMQGNVEVVRLLLEKNPTVDLRDNTGMTALYIACWKRHTTIVSMLLEKDPNIDLCNKYGNSPLFIASQEGLTDIVRLLLERNPNIDLCNNNSVNALYVACYYGHTATVIMLLEKDLNVDLCHKYGCCHLQQEIHVIDIKTKRNPLIRSRFVDEFNDCSIYARSIEGFEKKYTTDMTLWINKSMLDLCNTSGYRPLNIPIQNRHTDIIRLLFERNHDDDICSMNGVTALYIASYFGYSSIVSALLKKNPNVDLCSKSGCSPLFKASQCGHTDTVRLLLGRNSSVDLCDINGFSPLSIASQNGFTDIVMMLLDRQANVNLCNTDGCSPLLLASQYGHTDIVRLLLEKNPSVNICDFNGCSPLLIASQNGFTDIVRLLLERNPNVDLCNTDGCSPLLLARQCEHTDKVGFRSELNCDFDLYDLKANANVRGGTVKMMIEWNPCTQIRNCPFSCVEISKKSHTNIVKLLLAKNPYIRQCFKNGCSPLLVASYTGNTDIVRLLLEKKSNVDLCNADGLGPLFVASRSGHSGVVRLLLGSNSNVNLCTTDGSSPLSIAIGNGYTDVVKLLLERKPLIDLCNINGVSPLLFASQNGHTAIVRLLLDRQANVNLCNTDGCSPLLLASQYGHTDIVRLLLERNPNVDMYDTDRCSPLLFASSKGNTAIVRLLLQKKPNVNLCNNDGASPLFLASQNGHTDIVSLLLEMNPNVDLCNNDGCSPLILATQKGNTDIAKLLLERNSNVDLCSTDGFSPLLLASQNGYTDIVRLLLERNPNVDLCTTDGFSPLLLASQNGHTDIVRLVLKKKPNVDLCNSEGLTPLMCSCLKSKFSIAQLLIKNNVDINLQADDGGNSLYFCALKGNLEIAQLLLENNAYCNICIHSKQGITNIFSNHPRKTLHQVKQLFFDSLVENGSSKVKMHVVMKSVDYAFDVVAGSSPLHIACFIGWKDVVSCLLDHQANINLTKEDGTTPLFYASELGHEDIVRLLLEKGADTDTCRHDGRSPLNIATDNGHKSVIMMLTKHMTE
ncbi:Hypothetical predicted protein [Mytilus galloprovincialis]|uniref:Novel STAND NTPase 3 domain-containing protein n=1 Tax=Mytilus galloprovincialis TaxID=29158 RepID=A0A8B6HAB4_MYTGA|nr:Hypothetical predicted protein [Mytilus galloprovincialis]